jgi:rsbT co-antagonist protein RsbR
MLLSPTVPANAPLTEFDIGRRVRIAGLDDADLLRIAAVKGLVQKNTERYLSVFFDYVADLEEGAALFKRSDVLTEARLLKRQHLIALVEGNYGSAYVEERIRLGMLYNTVGLDVKVFLGGFDHMMMAIGADIMEQFGPDSAGGFAHFVSIQKVGFFDMAVIMDVLIGQRERTISAQQHAIRELSTPVLQLRERLLILPIIGLLDSFRAKQLTDGLLRSIRANRAKVVVMDITGVGAIDSQVANHLIQTVAAARLMGAKVIVTGMGAPVAQALVGLGIPLENFNTFGDLQGGLEEAERMLGYEVVRDGDHSPERV